VSRILAIDTSSSWCSVALAVDVLPPMVRHQQVSAGASQLLLPWVKELLNIAAMELTDLDAIAIGVGPGAFTGVRLGVAAAQGLATAARLPVLPVASLDAIAAMLVQSPDFIAADIQDFAIAIDARMDEIYWAKYHQDTLGWPTRIDNIALCAPEEIQLEGIEYLAGSAYQEFGDRLFSITAKSLAPHFIDQEIGIHALGVLACGQEMWRTGLQQDVHLLEPLYVRNKVAFTTLERSQNSHV
jgi:tRNA threonylcarbamoyladenosine biosynthesis protein TsaB